MTESLVPLPFKVHFPGFGSSGFVDRFDSAMQWCFERHGDDNRCSYFHDGKGGGRACAPYGVVWAQFLSNFYFLREEDAFEFKMRWG